MLLVDTAVSTDPLTPSVINLANLNGGNGFRLDGVAAYDQSGRSVSNTGDVNGDGFDDVIVGAPGADPNGNYSGSSYVVFGRASGFDAALDLSSLDGSNGFRLDGAEYDGSGYSVSSAGDVNGDSFDDVIIGGSYVVFGKASGFDPTMDLSSLDGSNGFRLDGASRGDYSGRSVSSAGDVNGDGFDDLIIGADGADPNDSYSGSSYVVFGRASGFAAALELSSLDGSNGFRLDGVAAGFALGWSVSNAGDVNGDGFDDVIVGERYGSSYVVFGKASTFDATLALASLDGSNGFRLGVDDRANTSVSSAGDVNGDGFDDLIIGSIRYSYSSSFYVVFGKASGFSATLDLSSLDGTNGVRLDGADSMSQVSGAGDVNGDGFDDLIVGAPGASPNGDFSGSSYVIFGSSNFRDIVTFVGTSGDDTLTGTTAAERFEAGDGNDTMIGGGGADLFQGGTGDDVIRVPDFGFLSMDGGAGNDTLELAGSGINLNLASFSETMGGIEAISLTGSGDNTLTLTAQDVFDLSDTTNTLIVNGNAGDRVAGLSQGWADGGMQGNFNVYTQRGAVLLVDVAVSTDPLSPGVISLSSLNGNNGFRLDGVAEYDSSGNSVSSAGDVNGDGFADVIIGAVGADPNGDSSGSSYVVFGQASGFDATLDLASLDGSNGFRLDGVAAFDSSGISVSNTGDVNGDGFDDVIVGAAVNDRNDDFSVYSGASYVMFGKASGFSATMNLSSLDGNTGFRLDGVVSDRSSFAVSNGGMSTVTVLMT